MYNQNIENEEYQEEPKKKANNKIWYKFWFSKEFDEKDCSEEKLQALFEKVACAIQTVCPFDDDEWNFSLDSCHEL